MEILNDLRNYYIVVTILFITLYDIIAFSLIKKISIKQLFKTLIVLCLIWFLLIISIGINTGITFTSRDHQRQWEKKYTVFEFNNISYNVSIKISSSSTNFKGFFIDTPLSLTLYDSTLKFNKGILPNNSKISIQIELYPHAYFASNNTYVRNLIELDTEYLGNNEYRIKTPDKYWILFYDNSGEKYISGSIIINNSRVAKSERVPFIEIEKGYVKSQVEMTRAITILTFWLIFIGLLPFIDRIIDWMAITYPSKFSNIEDDFDYI